MKPTFLKSNILSVLLLFLIFMQGCDYQPTSQEPKGFDGLEQSAQPAIEIPEALPLAIIAGPLSVAPPDGIIYEVHPGTTISGVREALRGAPGTLRYIKDGITIFIWNIENGFAFFAVDPKKALDLQSLLTTTGGKGSLVSVNTIKDFAKCLEDNGWKPVAAAEITASLRSIIAAGSQGVISIMIFPFVPDTMPEGVIGVVQ